MDDERAGQPTGKVENETKGGRYGTAPPDAPHHAPEIEPARGRLDEVDVPEGQPGSLPENAGRDPDAGERRGGSEGRATRPRGA